METRKSGCGDRLPGPGVRLYLFLTLCDFGQVLNFSVPSHVNGDNSCFPRVMRLRGDDVRGDQYHVINTDDHTGQEEEVG